MARPTLYNDEILTKTNDYIANFESYGDAIPTVIGLSSHLNISKRTLYNWSDDEAHIEFMHSLSMLKSQQHRELLNKGLRSEFNTAICKLMLMNNHGYSDKQKIENTINPGNRELKDYTTEELKAMRSK